MLVDPAAGRGRAGEADEVDVRVLDERRSDLAAEPLHDVEDAGRQDVVRTARRRTRADARRVLGRLQHRRVAAEDGRKDLPGVVRQRRVERDDERRDADRPPHRHHGSVRHRRRRRPPVEAPALAGDEEAHLDRGVRLAAARAPATCPSRRRRSPPPPRAAPQASAISRTSRPRSTRRARRPLALGAPRRGDRRFDLRSPERRTRTAASRPRAGAFRRCRRRSPGRPAAVGDEVRARHVRRRVRREEDDGPDDLAPRRPSGRAACAACRRRGTPAAGRSRRRRASACSRARRSSPSTSRGSASGCRAPTSRRSTRSACRTPRRPRRRNSYRSWTGESIP